MKLQVEAGMVPYLMITGDDIVTGHFYEKTVRNLIKETAEESDRFEGYPIRHKNFYFAGIWDEPEATSDEKPED